MGHMKANAQTDRRMGPFHNVNYLARWTHTCIDHYAQTVSEWSKDNTVSFGLRDMIRRFRDCLGR